MIKKLGNTMKAFASYMLNATCHRFLPKTDSSIAAAAAEHP
jgi:hypothetical protein